MNQAPHLVVTTHDSNYVYPWMLMTKSAIDNCSAPFKMIVGNLEGALSPVDLEFMKDYADYLQVELEIIPLKVSTSLHDCLGKKVTYYTCLLLADILTDDFVWLDSDILCNTGWDSIFEIKETFNNSNFAVAAAKDRQVTIETLISAPEKPIYIHDSSSYVNAGVIYFNPLVWKRNKLDLRWVETVLTADLLKLDLVFNEQNVLNYLLKEDLQLLPSKFNSIVGDSKLEPSLITHYAGYPKPWVLSAQGKALYLMAESMNWNRPQFRPSREGRFKTEYFQYWQAEEDLLDELRVNRPELYEETLRRKRSATREINRLEKIKYAIARFIGIEFLNVISGKKPKLTGIQSQLWQDFY